jgi:hypothetical protein
MLGKILDRPIYILESDLDTSGLASMARVLVHTLTKKPAAVLNMPAGFDDEEIYICGPVWGGRPAAPIKYFLQNAPIEGKKVHMLLTAGISHIKYADNGKKMIEEAGGIPGNVEVFASGGEAIEEQIRELML